MKESEFYNKLKVGMSRVGHVSRVESATSPGIADVTFAMSGYEWWFELKVEKSGKLYFELSQPIWMKNRLKSGVVPYVLWLSQDEQWVHLCSSRKIVAAEKTYEKDMAIVQSSDARQLAWKRKPTMDWQNFFDTLLYLKVPQS